MRLHGILMVVALVACLVSTGCGSDGAAGGGIASCSSAAGCTDYVGSLWTEASAQENCNQIPGSTFSADPCPTADLVGSCSVNQNEAGEFISRYYSPMFNADSAESSCGLMQGTWIP